eukprot:TRINITY_DN548_c0_g1_i1.p1 TRINITY_DN548_c0_g1~~TRINITY_DN548_c0_g1_i1.p1  ORF type:complete len:721 (-),score=95.57 TRINITY_DN548_c0_g1_i1:288-2450(-)
MASAGEVIGADSAVEAVLKADKNFIPVLCHLLKIQVCPLCSMRVLNIRSRVYSSKPPSPSAVLKCLHHRGLAPSGFEADSQSQDAPCIVCLGILHSFHSSDPRALVISSTLSDNQNIRSVSGECGSIAANETLREGVSINVNGISTAEKNGVEAGREGHVSGPKVTGTSEERHSGAECRNGENNASITSGPDAVTTAQATCTTPTASGTLLMSESSEQTAGRGISGGGERGRSEDGGGTGRPALSRSSDAGSLHGRSAGALEKVALLVKEGGHEIKSYCMEVTLPGTVIIREYCVWYRLRQAFPSMAHFSSLPGSDAFPVVSLKEAIKWAMIDPLDEALGVKYDANSDFRIALLYSHAETAHEVTPLLQLGAAGGRNRKRGRGGRQSSGVGDGSRGGDDGEVSGQRANSRPHYDDGGRNTTGHVAVAALRESSEEGESMGVVKRALGQLRTAQAFRAYYPRPLNNVTTICSLQVLTWRNSVYVGGRYLKYSRTVSQSRWLLADDERMGDSSVQEIIADEVIPFFKGDGYKFQAAGREDIDVRMLGNGRPFLLEIINARVLPPPPVFKEIKERINGRKEKWVGVRSLQLMGPEAAGLLREGESDKQKVYRALVWLSRPVSAEDSEKLLKCKELVLQQKTPIRVLHRRSPLIRERSIHSMSCELVPGSPHFMHLNMVTQAGTYVKEFVHGDFGRTQPNVGSLLGCQADIVELDVMDIKMDFL